MIRKREWGILVYDGISSGFIPVVVLLQHLRPFCDGILNGNDY